jgi:hypothetical protein
MTWVYIYIGLIYIHAVRYVFTVSMFTLWFSWIIAAVVTSYILFRLIEFSLRFITYRREIYLQTYVKPFLLCRIWSRHSSDYEEYYLLGKSQDSSVGIATGYGLDVRGSILYRDKKFFSALHSVKTGSGAHPFFYWHYSPSGPRPTSTKLSVSLRFYGAHLVSYKMGTWGSFLEGKAAEAWSWPVTSI